MLNTVEADPNTTVLTQLQAINQVQQTLLAQLASITNTLNEAELPAIHQGLLLRGTLLNQLAIITPQNHNNPALVTEQQHFNQLNAELGSALNTYKTTLGKKLSTASKQRSGLSQYAQAGHLPAEILYRDEA
jgi:hypothetical protein